MPSLVYITRIRPLSADLAQGLESAGYHVKIFGPGEITADECLLVMTSEAAPPALKPLPTATSGLPVAVTEKPNAIPKLPDIAAHLGAQAEVWNRIKAAAAKDAGGREPQTPSVAPSPGSVVKPADEVVFVPSQIESRVHTDLPTHPPGVVLSSPAVQEKPQESFAPPVVPTLPPPLNVTAAKQSERISPLPLPAISSRKHRPAKTAQSAHAGRRRQFWHAAATASALLVVAVVLLTEHASILPSTTNESAADDANHKGDKPGWDRRGPAFHSHGTRTANSPDTSAKAGSPGLESRRRVSDYDFVAEDYTTRFDLNAHHVVTLRSPGSRHPGRDQAIPKRIVVN